MAAQTLSSPSKARWDYDVFLSFRGDTRKNFTDRLYEALIQVQIRTFRDTEELLRGKSISDELRKAIRGSRIYIVVFSKSYASSTWCLDELAEIIDSCRENESHPLFPTFYYVDPSDVRKQTGILTEAFAKHEKRFPTDTKKVKRWRKALTEAASLSGWDVSNFADGIPHGISRLPKLLYLDLNHCMSLQSISEVPSSLWVILVNGCSSWRQFSDPLDVEYSPFFLECEAHNQVNLQTLISSPLVYVHHDNSIQELSSEDVQFPIIFLQNTEVPDWFSHQAIGSMISFRVPPFVEVRIDEITICASYRPLASAPNYTSNDGPIVAISFYNKTRGGNLSLHTKVPLHFATACCHIYRIPIELVGLGYFLERNYYFSSDLHRIYRTSPAKPSHLRIDCLDEMKVSIEFSGDFEVHKCGIHLPLRPLPSWITVSKDGIVTERVQQV